MIERDGFYWIPTLPHELRDQIAAQPDDRQAWPKELRETYAQLRAEFTRSKAEFISWMRKDRDSRMNRTAKLILAYLVDCLNFETGRCDPGQQAIADELFIGLSTVERSTRRIAEAGWVQIQRRGKTTTNFYFFRVSVAKVNGLLDLSTDLRERRIEARKMRLQMSDPSKMRDHLQSDPSEMTVHDPSLVTAHDPSLMTGKHMNRTLEGEHLKDSALSDIQGGTYPREDIPSDTNLFSRWIEDHIPDRSQHREAYRLLRERKMTPEILRRMAA